MGLFTRLVRQAFTPDRGPSLLVLDSNFPDLASAFTIAELNHYLEVFPDAEVLSANPAFDDRYPEYRAQYPLLAPRVRPLLLGQPLPNARLAYCVFLKNTARHLPLLKKHGIPFVMTLYPGGGFALDDPESDSWLDAIADSGLLSKVIVTQPLTRDYLVSGRRKYSAELVELIYGMVVHESYFQERAPKRRYGFGKPQLDVCFAAYLYAPLGVDKGYDTFISAAVGIAKQAPDVRFHVVGNFDNRVINVSVLGDRIVFHGPMHTPGFQSLLAGMDLIVSPNVPMDIALANLDRLGFKNIQARRGKFDGFPTGSCMEASLCGVGMVCSDVLGQNAFYRDPTEIRIVAPVAEAVAQAVLDLRERPDALRQLGDAGQARSRVLLAPATQLGRRREILGVVP